MNKAPETLSTPRPGHAVNPSLPKGRMRDTDQHPPEEWDDPPSQTKIRQSRTKNSPTSDVFWDSLRHPYYVINTPVFIHRNVLYYGELCRLLPKTRWSSCPVRLDSRCWSSGPIMYNFRVVTSDYTSGKPPTRKQEHKFDHIDRIHPL